MKSFFKKISVFAIIFVLFSPAILAKGTKKSKAKSQKTETAVYIPVEVVDALKIGDIDSAIRSLRLEASSPRSKYLLNQLQTAKEAEHSRKKNKDFMAKFNDAAAYHNLYLFLKGNGADSKKIFDDGVKSYQSAGRSKSTYRKNLVDITLAALYAAAGMKEKAEKFYKKVNPSHFSDEYRRFMGYALYFAWMGDAAQSIQNLEEAHRIKPDFTTFWIGVSDDFVPLYADGGYRELIKKWKVTPQDKGEPIL